MRWGGGGYLGDVRRESDKGCSGIDCSAGIFKFEGFITKGETIETDFPISTTSNGKPCNFARKVIFIVSPEKCLSTVFAIFVRISEVERKYFVIDQLQ
jgi:hypothetical protein